MKRSLSILLMMTLVLSLLMPAVVVAEEMLLPDIAAFAGDKLTVGEMADYEYCIQQTYTGSAENIQAVADAYIRLLKDKYNLLNTFSYTANVEDSYLRYDLAFIAKAAPDGFEVFTMNDSTYGYSANDCHLFICYSLLAGSDENFLQITYSSSFTYTDTGDRLGGDSVLMDVPEPTAAADVPQGYHTFVEPAVEAAVREVLGKETGEISYEELLSITEIDLDLYDEELASVEDLRYMTNLSSLVMSVRNLSDISPLAELTNLSSLTIHGSLGDHRNILSDLSPLSGLTNLKSLELYANRISDISPLAGLINLAELDLTANKICDLSPLAGLTNLTSLGLSGNDISDISPLAGLTNLTELFLMQNEISDISPLAGLTNLTALFLKRNEISDLSPLSGLTNLSTLAEGAQEGNTVIMVSAGENVVLKPLFFTAGAAEIQKPVWDNRYGTGTEIHLPGDFTEFDIEVSHNISYEMSISEDCADWLKVAPSTKAEMITTKHSFVADYFESSLGADRKGKIIFRNDLYDVTVEIAVRQTPIVPSGPVVPGLSTGADLVAFAQAVNAGASTSRWQNEAGEVVLLNDIDLTGMTEWNPIGTGTAKGTPAYNLVNPFSGVFNGQGYAIKGIQWTYNVTDAASHLYGLFGAIKDATIKNLVLGAEGDQITIVGSNANVIAVGALVGHAESSIISGIINNVSVVLADKNAEVPGDNPDATLMMLGGIAGTFRAPMTVGSKDEPVKNYGNVKTGTITNTANGGTGMNVAGVVAFTVGVNDTEMTLDYCYNYGEVSAPTGRGGGIIGTMGGATQETAVTVLSNSDNYGLIQDDIVGQFGGSKDMYNLKRMGGLVGGTVTNNVGLRIEYCTNYGNVFSQIGCRTGGFVGHNQAAVTGCVNKGIILANISYTDGAPQHGPGWACGYSGKHLVNSCAKGGRVGEWDTYKDNPSAAPEATMDNALIYKNSEYFDPSANF